MGSQACPRKISFAALSLLLLSQAPNTAASPQYPLCSQAAFNARFSQTDCWDYPQGGFANDQARNACFWDNDGAIVDWLSDASATCTCSTTREAAAVFFRNCEETSTDTMNTTPDMTVDQMMMEATGNANCTTSEPEEKNDHGNLSPAVIVAIVVPLTVGTPAAAAAFLQFLIMCGIVEDKNAWTWIKRRVLRRGRRGPAQVGAGDDEQPIREAGQVDNEQPMREAEQV